MNPHRTKRRDRELIDQLFRMAAPGCVPWKSTESRCPTGKRRWPTERAAAAALLSAQQTRIRRARGDYRGRLEDRAYACRNCDGYHLTSMSVDEYESKRSQQVAE